VPATRRPGWIIASAARADRRPSSADRILQVHIISATTAAIREHRREPAMIASAASAVSPASRSAVQRSIACPTRPYGKW
jgi:hypothetical protein